jgi:ligand-binding sensor domain-containing protein
MKQIVQLLLLIIFIPFSKTQPTWEFYGIDQWVKDIKVIGEDVWIGNASGLHILDKETEEGVFLQSVNSPLLGNGIREILPAENYVWIAMEEGGIARFDKKSNGNEEKWHHFTEPVQGSSEMLLSARNLMVDSEGTLWFDGAYDGRFALYAIRDEVLYDYTETILEDAFFGSGHGSKNIYYRTDSNSLHCFDVDTETTQNIDLPSMTASVYSYTAFNDELYVCLIDGGQNLIYRYDGFWHLIGETQEPIYLAYNNAAKGVDRMWYTRNRGIDDTYFIVIDRNQLQYYTFEDLLGTQIEQRTTTRILFEDSEGKIWFYNTSDSQQGDFVFSLENGLLDSYDIHHSFLRNRVYYRQNTFDCEGNLLIPDLTKFQVFNTDTLILHQVLPNRDEGDLQFPAYNPINCKYYVATDGFRTATIYEYDENHVLVDSIFVEDSGISCLYISSEGIMYAGMGLNGIGIYNSETNDWEIVSSPFYNSELRRNNTIISIEESKNGTLSFGTLGSLVVYDGVSWMTYDITNSPVSRASIHYIDENENIFVSNDGGIYKYDGTDWTFTSFFDPYKNYISDIVEDDQGNYWLGTGASGLLYWNGVDYQEYNILNSPIPSNSIREIIKHPITDDLWLLSNRGIIVFDPESSSTTFTNDEERNIASFGVYPNPSNGHFVIEPHFEGKYNLEIRNISGQVLRKEIGQLGNSYINLDGSGLNVIYIQHENKSGVRKIVLH